MKTRFNLPGIRLSWKKAVAGLVICGTCAFGLGHKECLNQRQDPAIDPDDRMGLDVRNTLSVRRMGIRSSAGEVLDDLELKALASDVARYCRTLGRDGFRASELVTFLAETHSQVRQSIESPFEYYFVVDPDGTLQRVCYVPIQIVVQGEEEQMPILVQLEQVMRL